MRRTGSVGVAALLALSLLDGCARPRPRVQTPPPVAVAPAPTPPAPPPAETKPTAPPLSVGPRQDLPTAAPAAPPEPPRPTPPPTAPPVSPGQRGRFVVLNFDNADIETVVHAASEILGFNYVLAPDVRGKVTVQTSGRIPQENVFGVLLAILEVHGFTAVKSGSLYKIVRLEGARERAVPTIVGSEADPNRTDDEVVTQIVPLRFSSAADVSTLLRPLISARGNLVAQRETNMLMITDTASNIRRLLEIIHQVDVEVALDELQIIPIRFADAADLATILNQLFASGRLRRATAVSGAPAPPPPPLPVPTPAAPRPVTPGAPGAEAVGAERAPLIIAERRSNSIIVHARRQEIETIRRLIGQLDINIYGGRRVFIYYAENAKAKDLAATLNAVYGARETVPATTPGATGTPTTPRRPGEPLLPPPPPPTTAPGAPLGGTAAPIGELGVLEGQVRFIADETTNAVIVTTFPRNWQEIEATVKQLDRMPRQVLIEVLVAEITLNDDTRLGIDLAIKEGRFNLASQAISTATPATISPISRELPLNSALTLPASGLTAFTFAQDRFVALLNALASQNRVNIVSNPHVMTSENKKAIINVSTSTPIVTSQQVPIGAGAVATGGQTTTAVVGTQTVEFRDAGVVLTVTPRIGERGTVALDVKQEVNALGPNVPPTNTPQIIKREAETSVVLLNNQTLVLGGLIQDKLTIDDRGIPFLKDIPILGYLFGAKVRTIEKVELVLLITPHVIGTALDAARITEQMRRATPELEESTRQAPRQPSPLPTPVPPPPPPPPPVEPPASQ